MKKLILLFLLFSFKAQAQPDSVNRFRFATSSRFSITDTTTGIAIYETGKLEIWGDSTKAIKMLYKFVTGRKIEPLRKEND